MSDTPFLGEAFLASWNSLPSLTIVPFRSDPSSSSLFVGETDHKPVPSHPSARLDAINTQFKATSKEVGR
jgi:hypothetical protein